MNKKVKTISESSVHGIIVSGEASESEEEELFDISFHEISYDNKDVLEGKTSPLQQRIVPPKPKTFLHQKLYKANESFYRRLNADVKNPLLINTHRISKLRSRLGSVYFQTSLGSQALEKSKHNIESLLSCISPVDCSLLPVKSL